ncbi:MAG TPA: 5-oxoprolinase subunit PxpA [Actinomycetales bacterium]|nr:5-oxoprolinase subunit PxpA [Actinomycetales bacterium]
MVTLDLNSDLGEGYGRWALGDDEGLLGVVTSANVACGFHAGDPLTMRQVCDQAVARQVSIGAQVGYHDLVGFGRRFIDVDPRQLTQEVIYQVAALDGFARVAGSRVRYVKPHGALYNVIGHHVEQATAVVEAVLEYDRTLPVLGLPGSVWLRLAERAGLTVVHESFADRAYASDGTLVPRGRPGAVLHDVDLIARRCVALATGEAIEDVDGRPLRLTTASVCVHGDTPGAVDIARRVRQTLEDAGVTVEPFA